MAGNTYKDDDKVLRNGITAARNYLLGRALSEAALWCIVTLGAAAVVMLAAELTLYLPAFWRITVLALALISLLGVAAWRAVRAAVRFGGLSRVARELELSHPELRGRLSSALEFTALERARFGESLELMRAAVEQARSLVDSHAKIHAFGVKVLERERKNIRLARRLAAALLGLFIDRKSVV